MPVTRSPKHQNTIGPLARAILADTTYAGLKSVAKEFIGRDERISLFGGIVSKLYGGGGGMGGGQVDDYSFGYPRYPDWYDRKSFPRTL